MASTSQKQIPLEEKTFEGQILEIYEKLKQYGVSRITLTGEPGVGKTWMARKIADLAVKQSLFDISLWVFLYPNHDMEHHIKSIAQQLSLIKPYEEWEGDNNSENDGKGRDPKQEDHGDKGKDPKQEDHGDKDKETKQEDHGDALKKKISKAVQERKKILVVYDGLKADKKVMDDVEKLLGLKPDQYKVLITAEPSNDVDPVSKGSLNVNVASSILSKEEALSLLREKMKETKTDVIEHFANKLIGKPNYSPASILMLARALSYFGKHDLNYLEMAVKEDYRVMQLLCSGSYAPWPFAILVDLVLHKHEFLHFSEMITYWILEGYLGEVECVEKAYDEGYRVLMDLTDCLVLKKIDAGYVVAGSQVLNLDKSNWSGVNEKANLGLAAVSEGGWKSSCEIMKNNGMIRTPIRSSWDHDGRTLIFNGDRFDMKMLSSKPVRVLVVFNPTFKLLPAKMFDLDQPNKLMVLVLRGCSFLENMNLKLNLGGLTVLEISGSSFSEPFPEDFFEGLPLRSLNLSGLKITQLPSSFYGLVELRWLILRGCDQLKEVKSLSRLTNLTVIDLAGAVSLTWLADKSFSKHTKLEMINLSRSQIPWIPFIRNLGQLKNLILSGCEKLERLRGLSSVPNLRILDLSGAKKLMEFHDKSLEDVKHLSIVDLSRTAIGKLPANIQCSCLYMKGCSLLKSLPAKSAIKPIEVLDLSGSSYLDDIGDELLDSRTSLRVLNLSETNVHTVTALSHLVNLRELLLSGCKFLQELPELTSLTKLEILNLSECVSLTKIPQLTGLTKMEELNLSGFRGELDVDFLNTMRNLRFLDLSNTVIKQLPSMSELKNLKFLSLRGCKGLETLPELEELTNLEVLDLSGTSVQNPPPASIHLRRRILPKEFSDMEIHQVGSKQILTDSEVYTLIENDPLHLCVHPLTLNGKIESTGRDFCQDLCFPTKQFSQFEHQRSLKLHGFRRTPDEIKTLLPYFDCLFLIDNAFQKWLSELGGFDNMKPKQIKGCWIEGCSEIQTLFHEDEQQLISKLCDDNFNLGISNAVKLKTIYSEKLPYESFQNLCSLELDCCPEILTVFSTFRLPENLRIVRIKFCNKLQTVFGGGEKEEHDKWSERRLPNLKTLELWELPELTKIGCKVREEVLKKPVRCPKLKLEE